MVGVKSKEMYSFSAAGAGYASVLFMACRSSIHPREPYYVIDVAISGQCLRAAKGSTHSNHSNGVYSAPKRRVNGGMAVGLGGNMGASDAPMAAPQREAGCLVREIVGHRFP